MLGEAAGLGQQQNEEVAQASFSRRRMFAEGREELRITSGVLQILPAIRMLLGASVCRFAHRM